LLLREIREFVERQEHLPAAEHRDVLEQTLPMHVPRLQVSSSFSPAISNICGLNKGCFYQYRLIFNLDSLILNLFLIKTKKCEELAEPRFKK